MLLPVSANRPRCTLLCLSSPVSSMLFQDNNCLPTAAPKIIRVVLTYTDNCQALTEFALCPLAILILRRQAYPWRYRSAPRHPLRYDLSDFFKLSVIFIFLQILDSYFGQKHAKKIHFSIVTARVAFRKMF